MERVNEKMEACFVGSTDELKALSADPDWRVRFAAAVAMGERKDPVFLPELERMLKIEDSRPLFSQPVTEFVGVTGDSTRTSERVKPFQVKFPYPVDDETQEAWKTRGRVKQAVLFAIYEIGEATDTMRDKFHHYLKASAGQDATVKAAAARALIRVGNLSSLPYCEEAVGYDEWCTMTEARKAIEVLKND